MRYLHLSGQPPNDTKCRLIAHSAVLFAFCFLAGLGGCGAAAGGASGLSARGKSASFGSGVPGRSPPHAARSAIVPSTPPKAPASSAILEGMSGSNSTPAMRTASRHWYRIAPSSAPLPGSLASLKGSVAWM